MFKRTAVLFALFAVSHLAVAQPQPLFWPWLPVQVWAMPANGQSLPFPTPFWLWVAPPEAVPQLAPVEEAPHSAQEAATPGAAPLPVAVPVVVPAATAESPVTQVAETPPPTVAPAVTLKVAPSPARIRLAPVAKAKIKASAKSATHKARKLCFKDGKLDVCP